MKKNNQSSVYILTFLPVIVIYFSSTVFFDKVRTNFKQVVKDTELLFAVYESLSSVEPV